MCNCKYYQHITYDHPFYIIYIIWIKLQNVHILWDTFPGQPNEKEILISLPRISQAVYSFPLLSFKNVCFAVQIPRKLDICMKTNIILSGKNDSSISDRQVRDCPDVNEKTVPQRIPRRYKEDIKRLQERYDLHEGVVINVSLKEFRGICERDYPKIEAYLGLKKFLLRTFGVTLNIHSQKTKVDFDKNTAITQK